MGNAKRRIAAGLVALVTVTAGASLLHGWTVLRFRESTDNAYVEADVSTLAPRVAGLIRDVAVTDNQSVAAGDVLVVLDDQELRARERAAEAQLALRRAALAAHHLAIAVQEAQVDRAVADLSAGEAEHTRSGLDRARYQQLAQGEAAARQRIEGADAAARKAEALLGAARAALAAERTRLDLVRLRQEELEAAVREAEALRDQALLDLGSAVIRSPVAGIVANRTARVGQYVRPGTPLLSVVPLHAAYVTANFKETQVERMRPGQAVGVEIDAYPGVVLAGQVESVAPASGARFTLLPTENASGNFTKIVQRIPVRIALKPQTGRPLRMGMSVIVSVDTRAGRGE